MDLIDKLPEIQRDMAILHHNITMVNLAADGDRAEGEICILAMHEVRAPDRHFDMLIGGRYFVRYERRDGVWKFSYRAILADWCWPSDPTAISILFCPLLRPITLGR